MKRKTLLILSCVFVLCLTLFFTAFSIQKTTGGNAENKNSVSEKTVLPNKSTNSVVEKASVSEKAVSSEASYGKELSEDISYESQKQVSTASTTEKIPTFDYKKNQTLTIQGVTYNFQYKSTEKGSVGKTSEYCRYETASGEQATYDAKTGKLLSFSNYYNVKKSETRITKDKAILIADGFLKSQCDISQFTQDCCNYNEQRNRYIIEYSRKHLGLVAESLTIWISDAGEILFYSGDFDTDNTVFSVKEINDNKVREAMIKILGKTDFVLSSYYSWTVSSNNKPAIQVSVKNEQGTDFYEIEINPNAPYTAYYTYSMGK